MASEATLLAARFSVSAAQTRSLVASWLDNGGSAGTGTGSESEKERLHDDLTFPTEDENDDYKDEEDDNDVEFAKKYKVIVGRGGIGTPQPADPVAANPVNSFRQRKSIEFMQKQIQKRKADEMRPGQESKKSREEEDEEDEEESRSKIDTHRHKKASLLDDLISQKHKKKKKKKKKTDNDAN